MSQIDSRTTGKIAEETQRDAISMRTIAFITMFFLPATSVASVFDLSFFSQGIFTDARYVWIYFVASISLTAVVLSTWVFWITRRGNRVRRSEVSDFLRDR
jgi:Mg2+ and Co2+ transporter CorA